MALIFLLLGFIGNRSPQTFNRFLTSTLLNAAGDITIVQSIFVDQLAIKLGSTSSKRHYLLNLTARSLSGVCTIRMLLIRQDESEVIKIWKSSGGNSGENMLYCFSCLILDAKKGDQYYFQFWHSPGESAESIEILMIPITYEIAL